MAHALTTLAICLIIIISAVWAQDPNGCIKDPSNAVCKSFEYPESLAKTNNDALCSKMPSMPFCSVKTVCGSATLEKSETYCDSVSIFKGICSPDYDGMTKMSNCVDWKTMCVADNKTVVPSCNIAVLQGVPSSSQTRKYVDSICSEMNMSGCDKCAGNKPCDLLNMYSTLCLEMPDMDQCTSWKRMCKFIPTWPFCPLGSNGDVVQMRMYFHTGIEDYVLFKQWVPRTWLQYFATCFAVILFGVLYEGLKYSRHVIELRMSGSGTYHAVNDPTVQMVNPPFRPLHDLLRASLHFIEVIWGLLVMLIAMTYNVGLLFCVGIGAFLGSLIFGRFMKYEAKASSCH